MYLESLASPVGCILWSEYTEHHKDPAFRQHKGEQFLTSIYRFLWFNFEIQHFGGLCSHWVHSNGSTELNLWLLLIVFECSQHLTVGQGEESITWWHRHWLPIGNWVLATYTMVTMPMPPWDRLWGQLSRSCMYKTGLSTPPTARIALLCCPV